MAVCACNQYGDRGKAMTLLMLAHGTGPSRRSVAPGDAYE